MPDAVDLDTCAREPIHIPGAVQSFAAMVVADRASRRIVQHSANLADWLADESPLGRSLGEAFPEPARAALERALDAGGLVDQPRLVFSGVLERYSNLRLILSHLGGALPFLAGRLASGSDSFEGIEKKISGDARDYFQMFYLDTIAYEPEVLAFGVGFAGVEKIVFGTDSPFFGERNLRECLAVVNDCERLSDADRRAILTETPRKLFGIDAG